MDLRSRCPVYGRAAVLTAVIAVPSLTGCYHTCGSDLLKEKSVYGGGVGSISMVAEAPDGFTASAEVVGWDMADFDQELPQEESFVYVTGDQLYVQVCVAYTAEGCDPVKACFRSGYGPISWVDGEQHDIAGQSRIYIVGQASSGAVADASITMSEIWAGQATLTNFEWEVVTRECFDSFGATSAEVVWSLDESTRVAWEDPIRCE